MIKDVEIEFSTIELEDIWANQSLFGEEANAIAADSFEMSVESLEPESVDITFSREDDERKVIIEQQGDELVLFYLPNGANDPTDRILLSDDQIVTPPESKKHTGPGL